MRTRGHTLACVKKKAPRLVLGLGLSGLAAAVDGRFRTRGWDVVRAGTGDEAARVAFRYKAPVVVMAVEGDAESGVLACAKLVLGRPLARVVLVGPEDRRLAKFARLAGAVGYLPRDAGPAAIERAVMGN